MYSPYSLVIKLPIPTEDFDFLRLIAYRKEKSFLCAKGLRLVVLVAVRDSSHPSMRYLSHCNVN